MSVELNHTIVHARDNRESAAFLTELLGLEITAEWGPFVAVALGNGVTLDFATVPAGDIAPQHYAFLVSEEVFDAAYAQIARRGITHYADPHGERPGEINHDGGRGVHFLDPAGHFMELLTVPYGGWPARGPGNQVAPGVTGRHHARMSEELERWTQATVYPDMWADPDDDPRENTGPSPDGELATLQDFLTGYRLTLRMKCGGLDAEQLARRSVPPSTMSLLGLVRHLAETERDWRNWIGDEPPLAKLYGARDADFDDAVAEQSVVDAAYRDLEREQEATDAALAAHPDLGERVGKDKIAIRELMVHRIEEYARHCGHADLLRERVDGRVGQ